MTQEFLHSRKNELKNAKEAVTISSMGEITMQLEHTETLQLDYELPEYPEIEEKRTQSHNQSVCIAAHRAANRT